MVVRRILRVVLWVVAVPAVLVFAVRAFVGDVKYVDSRSMEPVLHGSERDGEYVFVLYGDVPSVERAQLVVLTRPGQADPVVKRVAGLPGEEVQIVNGDLYIKSKILKSQILAPDQPRPPLVPIYDQQRHDFAERFLFDPAKWARQADGRLLDVHGARAEMARLRQRLLDDYLAPDGGLVAGEWPVNDAALEFELRIEAPWRRFVARLTEENDQFDLELTPAPDGGLHLRLTRSSEHSPTPATLVEADAPAAGGAWRRVRFANIDNLLTVDLDGEVGVLKHAYAANEPHQFSHRLPRIELGGEELRAELRGLKLWRDVTWFSVGAHGTAEAATLAPDELFVLGDNSRESTDSREWGPVKVSSVVGRPLAVVWPPARWRRL